MRPVFVRLDGLILNIGAIGAIDILATGHARIHLATSQAAFDLTLDASQKLINYLRMPRLRVTTGQEFDWEWQAL